MVIFFIFEVVVILLLLMLAITQIAIPVIKGRKMFPIFRRQGSLETALVAKKQKEVETELEKKLNERGKEMNDV